MATITIGLLQHSSRLLLYFTGCHAQTNSMLQTSTLKEEPKTLEMRVSESMYICI
jgi:hypothetical protein